jgi:bromodomain-containing factor 1
LAAPPTPIASSPAAGPSTTAARRQSISQVPAIRRSSDGPDSARPKREIHPPASKDLGYTDATRKPKRRNDPQLQWVNRTIKSLETTQKYYDAVSPFLYPVEDIIKALPEYSTLIKHPIDLLRIKSKLEEGVYEDASQVDADMKLMVRNAMTFNAPHDVVHISAVRFGEIWEDKWKTLPPKETRDTSEDPLADDYIDEASDEEDGEFVVPGSADH